MKSDTRLLEVVEATVTILVDNTVMELIPNSKFVDRLSKPSHSYLSEHGFSALIEVEGKKILLDTGSTGIAVTHNLKLLGIKPEDIDMVVVSHGHNDHTGGLSNFPGKIIAHPDAFLKRYLETPTGFSYDLTSPNHAMFIDRVEFHKKPVQLAKGVWTTGEITRKHLWETLNIFRIEKNGKIEGDEVFDDQGVFITSSKGLVIIGGCSHAGIINTVEQSINISGVSDVYCVIGGFHLIGPGEKKIDKTIEEFKRLNVKKIVPIHCTGFEGIKRISNEMPGEFEYVTTGCRMHF